MGKLIARKFKGNALESLLYSLEYSDFEIIIPHNGFVAFKVDDNGSRIYRPLEKVDVLDDITLNKVVEFIIIAEDVAYVFEEFAQYRFDEGNKYMIIPFILKKLIFERDDTAYDVRKLVLRLLNVSNVLMFEAFEICDEDELYDNDCEDED
jgi:hypothetical protein